MIAMEGMTNVSQKQFAYVPSANWNWKPAVADLTELDKSFISASGNSSTTRNTFSSQQDHGENE
jgi:hypothetical protein